MLDPLSILVGIPVLGPIVAWQLKEAHEARRDHDQQLKEQRAVHVTSVEKLQDAYQSLASKIQDQFASVVAENTSATRGLEKAVDSLVRLHEKK